MEHTLLLPRLASLLLISIVVVRIGDNKVVLFFLALRFSLLFLLSFKIGPLKIHRLEKR
jgi:hypothetical protein